MRKGQSKADEEAEASKAMRKRSSTDVRKKEEAGEAKALRKSRRLVRP